MAARSIVNIIKNELEIIGAAKKSIIITTKIPILFVNLYNIAHRIIKRY